MIMQLLSADISASPDPAVMKRPMRFTPAYVVMETTADMKRIGAFNYSGDGTYT
jgi:hypothetical protein